MRNSRPDQTKPNRTKPNRTEPNRTEPNQSTAQSTRRIVPSPQRARRPVRSQARRLIGRPEWGRAFGCSLGALAPAAHFALFPSLLSSLLSSVVVDSTVNSGNNAPRAHTRVAVAAAAADTATKVSIDGVTMSKQQSSELRAPPLRRPLALAVSRQSSNASLTRCRLPACLTGLPDSLPVRLHSQAGRRAGGRVSSDGTGALTPRNH